MRCPNCCDKLGKRAGAGEHIKQCSNCGASWFLLECIRGKDVGNKLDEAERVIELLRRYQPN